MTAEPFQGRAKHFSLQKQGERLLRYGNILLKSIKSFDESKSQLISPVRNCNVNSSLSAKRHYVQ